MLLVVGIGRRELRSANQAARAAHELPTYSDQCSRDGFRNYPKTASD